MVIGQFLNRGRSAGKPPEEATAGTAAGAMVQAGDAAASAGAVPPEPGAETARDATAGDPAPAPHRVQVIAAALGGGAEGGGAGDGFEDEAPAPAPLPLDAGPGSAPGHPSAAPGKEDPVRAIGAIAARVAAREALLAAAEEEDSIPRRLAPGSAPQPRQRADAGPAPTTPASAPAPAEASPVPPEVARKLGRVARGRSAAVAGGGRRAGSWLAERKARRVAAGQVAPGQVATEPAAPADLVAPPAPARAADHRPAHVSSPGAAGDPAPAPAPAPAPPPAAGVRAEPRLPQERPAQPEPARAAARTAPQASPRPAPQPQRPPAPPPSAVPRAAVRSWSARLPLIVGNIALLLLLGGFGVWSVTTSLTGAVLAPGTVAVESNRQIVQHPDGGVVKAIHVREGDVVEPGQVLIELDGTRLASQLAVVEAQLGELAARRARLLAERDGESRIEFPPDLLARAAADPGIAAKLEDERALFTAREEALELQSGLVAEQNRQIENRVVGVEAQLEATRTQIELTEAQLADQEELLERGLTQASQVLDLRRALAELKGRAGQFEAEIAQLRGQAAGNQIELLKARTERREQAVSTLRDIAFSEIELSERRLALIETLSRLDVRAPVGGIVYNNKVFALQSVVQPAEPLMYIVPQDQPLVIRARVNAINIDEVHVGQEVALRFSAFDQRLVPELKGRVSRISADVMRDDVTGENYYEADVTPEPGELDKLGGHVVVPGMPVEAFIRTRERSAFTYLTEPFTAFFARAFRE
jgi:HlyD family secretion protein